MMDKETKDLLEELKQSNGYISISELAKRFEKIDMLYNHDYWNLTQILANINLIIPVELDVIHCKDCKHWVTGVIGETENIKCCEYGGYMVGAKAYATWFEVITSKMRDNKEIAKLFLELPTVQGTSNIMALERLKDSNIDVNSISSLEDVIKAIS